MSKNPELILRFKTIIDTLDRELYKAKSEDLELDDQLDIQEELKRLIAKSSDLMEYIELVDQNLYEYAKDFDTDSRFKIGFREFEKVQESSNAKLDEIKLAEFVKDQDQLSEFFEKKPKNQKEVQKLINTLGLKIDIDMIYTKGTKDNYKIKFK